ncbi:Crp/Fnr family transcriptional regulator [Sphingomonas xinjiangensis]|uniref:CRP-like cAMP-binding protein n=1 Tax=Sphingomonas xinjiangensis TaxID=643568 RepID=A0A840Y9U3_9SPHN|nr:Crp/Fnr family transcriptional regulator [Sphingomonas xinjiangensis]MBB5708819.1 CRP-like cAMP-binding protein [Sphingomonas xinjiangensis]
MIDKHLLKLRARDDISADEEAAIRSALGETIMLPADHTFISPGTLLEHSTLVLDGIVCRYKDLSNGQRQITELHVAGDFADLHSFTLQYLDHSVMTLTPCRIVRMPHKALTAITEQYPHLTRVYWFSTNLDAAIHREWELSLGRRSAIQRIAHLFCEMQLRLSIVGLASERHFDLPVTQAVLAECLGLTPVHVNRVLKELRETGLLEFRSGRVTILDLRALRNMADFDPTYLYLERKRPR